MNYSFQNLEKLTEFLTCHLIKRIFDITENIRTLPDIQGDKKYKDKIKYTTIPCYQQTGF